TVRRWCATGSRPGAAVSATAGTCEVCGRLRPLRADTGLARHLVAWPVSARAVRTVGTGMARRTCPGSGRPRRAGHPTRTPTTRGGRDTMPPRQWTRTEPDAVVSGWTVATRSGRVWLHHAGPDADGDLTPDAAASLGCRAGTGRRCEPPKRPAL
ncbi:MAG TPA: hypothetical protein VGQ26_06790, partial [Streptosporangiaceae bacterium]|nr:hypothetical protein [Streptosporangiaceae bacterium]